MDPVILADVPADRYIKLINSVKLLLGLDSRRPATSVLPREITKRPISALACHAIKLVAR